MTNALAPTSGNALLPAATLQDFLWIYQTKKEFVEKILNEGTDFGKIPGAGDKPALFKPGAEKFTSFFGLSPVFEDVQTVEDWTGADHSGEPFFYYRQKCKLYIGERLIASADGSCNSWEKKYRYRNGERLCPECSKATIIKGRAEYGGGFVCFAKKGGCGAKFQDSDKRITDQETGQVKNPDVAELVNTILKMAQKRALVAAVLIGCGASDYFTQDVEDYVTGEYTVIENAQQKPQAQSEQKQSNGNSKPAQTAQATPQPPITSAKFSKIKASAGLFKTACETFSGEHPSYRNAGNGPDMAAIQQALFAAGVEEVNNDNLAEAFEKLRAYAIAQEQAQA